MKLKFINLLLASVLLVGSAQVFTSCKDNEADLYVNLKEDTITLKQRLEQDEAQLKDLEGKLNKEIADRISDVKKLTDELNKTNAALDALKKDMQDNYATKKELEDAKKALEAKISELNTKIEQNISDIKTLKSDVVRIDAAIAAINTQISDINAALEQIKKDVEANHQDILTINTTLGEIKLDITNIKNDVVKIYEELAALNTKYNDLEGRVTVIEGTLQQVQSDINTLNVKVAGLENFMNTWAPVLPEIQKNAADALALANKNANDIAALQALVDLLKGQIELGNAQCNAALADVQSQIDNLAAQVANCATLEELAYVNAQLQQQASDYYNAAIGYTVYMCAGLRAYIEECMQEVNNNMVDLDNKIDTSVATLEAKIAAIEEAIANGNQAVLDELNAKIDALDDKIGDLDDKIGDLNDKIDDLNTTLSEKIAEVIATYIPQIQDKLDDINSALTEGLNQVNDDIADVKDELEGIKTELEKVTNRIEEVATRINGIIIQQTDNAVFGTLNLPIGITSNMLLAYASDNAVDAFFPTTEGYYSYNGVVDGLGVSENEVLPFKGNDEVNCNGAIMERDEETGLGVLGTVYLTVNPANVDLTDKKFGIVTSTGKVLPIQIAPVESDKELNFGYTRASKNGFYEAKALIDVKDLDAVRFTLDKNFKSTVASIVKDPSSLKNKQTIAQLANALYNQVNGVLPAYGLQASWTESTGENLIVTSQYNLAAATFNPLALGTFLAIDGKLPQIPNLPDLSNLSERFDVVWNELTGKLNIKLYDPNDPFVIDLGGGIKLNISIPEVELGDFSAIEVNVPLHGVEVTVPIDVKVYDSDGVQIGTAIGESTATLNTEVTTTVDLSSLATDIQDAINEALDGVRDINNLETEINDQLQSIVGQIQSKVNDMLKDMQNTIDNAFDTVKNFVDGKLNSLENRLGAYVDRVQSLINRVNGVLSHPSHYMQPVLFYKGINGNVGRMSTAANMPTVIASSVSNPGIVLVPTTYTLETVVPLYQKYVAVTKVWKNGDAKHVNVPAVQEAVNNTQYINEVVNAQRHLIACPLQKGYTYEILYQGLDYSGKVSGNKYYVTVK